MLKSQRIEKPTHKSLKYENIVAIDIIITELIIMFASLIAVHHVRSSSIVTLLVLCLDRSFICIWARICLVAGRAEAYEVEHMHTR